MVAAQSSSTLLSSDPSRSPSPSTQPSSGGGGGGVDDRMEEEEEEEMLLPIPKELWRLSTSVGGWGAGMGVWGEEGMRALAAASLLPVACGSGGGMPSARISPSPSCCSDTEEEGEDDDSSSTIRPCPPPPPAGATGATGATGAALFPSPNPAASVAERDRPRVLIPVVLVPRLPPRADVEERADAAARFTSSIKWAVKEPERELRRLWVPSVVRLDPCIYRLIVGG